MKKFRYGTRNRPPGPGAIPKKGLQVVESFDSKKEYSGHLMYGYAEYNRQLSPEEIKEYELVHIEEKSQNLENEGIKVRFSFSEHPDINTDALYSLAEADKIMAALEFSFLELKKFDREINLVERVKLGYFKTDFQILYNDEGTEKTYEGRYDIGDGSLGIVNHIKNHWANKNMFSLDPDESQDYHTNIFIPLLNNELDRKDEERTNQIDNPVSRNEVIGSLVKILSVNDHFKDLTQETFELMTDDEISKEIEDNTGIPINVGEILNPLYNSKNIQLMSRELEEFRDNLSSSMFDDYSKFVKALISIEKGINNEQYLEYIVKEYMEDDDMMLLNDCFDSIMKNTDFTDISPIGKFDVAKMMASADAKSLNPSYEPIGKFYYVEGDEFVAIDNSSGHAYVESFDSIVDCLNWLNNDFEMSDYLEKTNKEGYDLEL